MNIEQPAMGVSMMTSIGPMPIQGSVFSSKQYPSTLIRKYSRPSIIRNFWDLGNLFRITNFRIFEDSDNGVHMVLCSVPENSVRLTRFPDKRVPDNRGLTVYQSCLSTGTFACKG